MGIVFFPGPSTAAGWVADDDSVEDEVFAFPLCPGDLADPNGVSECAAASDRLRELLAALRQAAAVPEVSFASAIGRLHYG